MKKERMAEEERLVEYFLEQNRPRAWAARALNLSPQQMKRVARNLGLNNREGMWRGSLEKYDALEQAVEEQWPLREIERTYGIDFRTVQRWFPEYKGMEAGGGGDVREAKRLIQNFRARNGIGSARMPQKRKGSYK